MKDLVTLAVAQRLFLEARNYASGRENYIGIGSEIRAIAVEVFGVAYAVHLTKVCDEIFYVLACEFMDVPR